MSDNKEVVFYFNAPAEWTYCIVPADNVIINGMPFKQERKVFTLFPGVPNKTSDQQTIDKLRNHKEYGGRIQELGVHIPFLKKETKPEAPKVSEPVVLKEESESGPKAKSSKG